MANFEQAHRLTKIAEGGYANNPADRGGETAFGVARNSNPSWPGWKIVDQIKKSNPKSYVSVINKNPELQELARQLFKTNYWDAVGGDKIINQFQANQLFDMAINAGVGTAIKLVQRSLGVPETGRLSASLINQINNPGYV